MYSGRKDKGGVHNVGMVDGLGQANGEAVPANRAHYFRNGKTLLVIKRQDVGLILFSIYTDKHPGVKEIVYFGTGFVCVRGVCLQCRTQRFLKCVHHFEDGSTIINRVIDDEYLRNLIHFQRSVLCD